jgi:HK97 family phage prohead protease
METIYKILENCEVKKVGERQYEFTASTADMDRDGESIEVSGWDLKNFKKNPVIMFAHDYRTLPIGKATKIGVKDGKLVDVVEFPPEGTYEFADTVARLVDAGYLKTQSVGFIPKTWTDADFEDDAKGQKPRRTYTKQELLEISIVPVPSNPNALMNAVKEGVITQKQFKSITEKTLVEDIVNAPIVDLTEEKHERKTGQEQIVDEIDYLKSLIEQEGLSEDGKKSFVELLRVSGYDKPVKDMEKLESKDSPEETLNQSNQIDDERIKLIVEQVVKQVVKNS